jgi:hypothetical protein
MFWAIRLEVSSGRDINRHCLLIHSGVIVTFTWLPLVAYDTTAHNIVFTQSKIICCLHTKLTELIPNAGQLLLTKYWNNKIGPRVFKRWKGFHVTFASRIVSLSSQLFTDRVSLSKASTVVCRPFLHWSSSKPSRFSTREEVYSKESLVGRKMKP